MNPAGLFVNTAVVNARSWLQEANGSAVLSASLASSSFACNIQPRSSSEGMTNGRDMGRGSHIMYYPTTVTLDHDDTVTSGGVTYKVIGPPRNPGGRSVFYEVDLEQEV